MLVEWMVSMLVEPMGILKVGQLVHQMALMMEMHWVGLMVVTMADQMDL